MLVNLSKAQSSNVWNGKKCAVVLTYDDALNVHLDNVIPALDSFNLSGTFYIVGNSPVLSKRMAEWQTAAAEGHELGNHTLTHPCDGSLPGRGWVSAETDLSKYSVSRLVDEIKVTSTLLHAIDGKTQRTFAFTCGDTKIDTTYFYADLENDFVAARGVIPALKTIDKVNLNDINCYGINGQNGDYMISLVNTAIEQNALLVFLFHGVGGEHDINVSLENHRRLLQYLSDHNSEIWVAPLVEVAAFIKEYNK